MCVLFMFLTIFKIAFEHGMDILNLGGLLEDKVGFTIGYKTNRIDFFNVQ